MTYAGVEAGPVDRALATDPRAPRALEDQAGPPGATATRHLQAAAHLDRVFRDRVITELVEERHRVPAPAPGVDTAAVLAECLRARRYSLWTALACTVVLLVGLAADEGSTLFALGFVMTLLLYRLTVSGAARVVLRVLPVYDSPERRRGVQRVLRVLMLPVAVYGMILITGVFTFLYWLAFQRDTVDWSSFLSAGDSGPGLDVSAYYTDGGVGAYKAVFVVLLAWVAVGAVARHARARRLAELGDPQYRDAPWSEPPWLAPVFQVLRSKAPEAETVYGDFEPFVGSGLRVDKWSVQAELRPEKPGAAPPDPPLAVSELHGQISAWLKALALGDAYPGDVLHQIEVHDRVLRSGLRVEPHQDWFGALSAPAGVDGRRVLRDDWVQVLDQASHPRLRHYVEGRAELWSGQLVVSTFVRVSVQGLQLYVEGLDYVLPPVAARYREVDQALSPGGLDLLVSCWTALVNLGRDLGDNLGEVGSTIASLSRTSARRRWRAGMLRSGRMVQHAPRVSVRELGAESEFQVLFQFLDAKRVLASLRERTLTAVVAAMQQRGYDTSVFERAAQTVNIDNSIQNYGSTINGAQAAGEGARASSRPSVPEPRMGVD